MKDINRRICAEAYAIYYYTRCYGGDSFIRSVITDDFADILCECHASIASHTDFPKAMREQLFTAFLHWEQQNIVEPSVAEAFGHIGWGLITYLALRTRVDMAYLGRRHHLKFENFASQDERIRRGLQAYHRAEDVGLPFVEDSLRTYKLMPQAFHDDPGSYFKVLELAYA